MSDPFLSICIPLYNRPNELRRLLNSVEDANAIEIVLCEDKSPKRAEIRAVVEEFKQRSGFNVAYYENAENLGYDKNLRELLCKARGTYCIFMGDDDEFVPGGLAKLLVFLKDHEDVRYVLRSYYLMHKDGQRECFRYFEGNQFFTPSPVSYLKLFRKSVFISGFTIHRESTLPLLDVDVFDGTLLFQLYLVAEIALKYPTAYFDEPLTQGYEGGVPFFGNAAAEKDLYTPGTITVENSLRFLQGFFKITKFIDAKYQLHSTQAVKQEMSKYSYPILSIQRNKGRSVFLYYVRELNKLGFNDSVYYYLYVAFLLVFGKRVSDAGVQLVKRLLGRTPQL